MKSIPSKTNLSEKKGLAGRRIPVDFIEVKLSLNVSLGLYGKRIMKF